MRSGSAAPFHRFRSTVRDRSLARILLALAAAVAAAVTIGSVTSARSLRDTYGHRIRVTVARGDLAVGHEIRSVDVEELELPEALIADGAANDPIRRTVIEPILAGEVIVERRLSGSTAAGIDALIGAGTRAITIERDPTTPPLAPGDRVDLFAPAVRGGSVRVARRARVLAVDDHAVSVAVTESEAPAVARASIDKIVLIALIGAG